MNLPDKQIALSPRDFYVALALAYLNPAQAGDSNVVPRFRNEPFPPVHPDENNFQSPIPIRWTYDSLGREIGLSPSRVHASVHALADAKLLSGRDLKAKLNRSAMANFVIYGARYAFPAMLGTVTRGIPTGAASDAFKSEEIVKPAPGQGLVWPSPQGQSRGISLQPLCESVLKAYDRHEPFHQALVAFDALRAGSARDQKYAEDFFRRTLAWKA